jgi:hypothetical protein
MKQKYIFLISIFHDEDENSISTKIVQGPIKRDFETNYVVDDNGNDHWVSKEIVKEFKVVKNTYLPERCEKPIVEYAMGFIWPEGADEHYVRFKADECQRRCKLPVIDRLNVLRNEIDKAIEKLIESKTCVRI